MARKQIDLRKILTHYPGSIQLEKPSLPKKVRILAKKRNFDPAKLYRITAMLPGESSVLIVVKNDRGEPICFQESEVVFQNGT